MKNKNHGLSEKEMELVQLLMSECKTTSDVQDTLKRLFAGTIEQMLEAEMDQGNSIYFFLQKQRRIGI